MKFSNKTRFVSAINHSNDQTDSCNLLYIEL